MNEPDKTYFMIEPPSQTKGQANKIVLSVCNNNRCQYNDNSISGCELYGKHSVDLCSAFISETAAERIAALENALKRIGDISWGYGGDCGAQAIIDSVLDT